MRRLALAPICLGLLALPACSAGGSASSPSTGGTTTSATGGASGAFTSSGGASAVTGGTTNTGGATSTGGQLGSGGASTGGSLATGGNLGKGGSLSGGGTVGSSGPPPAIGGFTVTIPASAIGAMDPTCGVQAFMRERKPTEMILVLDRSASMKDEPSGSTLAKWDMVKPAVVGVIQATNASLSWGLKLYPESQDTDACSAESIVPLIHVPVAASNATAVVGAINATAPEGDGTPTGDAIKFATDHLRGRNNANPKYILLATDGDPSCPSGNAAVTYAVSNIAAALTAGFPTFVIGVDTSKDSSVERLNLMAVAGGRPRPVTATSPAAFYLASTQADLTTALQTITGQVASCVFELDPPPPVPDNIAVDFNGQRATHDPTRMNGWEYTSPDHTSLEVYGSFCEKIKMEAMNQVEIKYGCPNTPIPVPG